MKIYTDYKKITNDNLRDTIIANPNCIIYTYDNKNELQNKIFEELKTIENDEKIIIPLDANSFVGFNFSINFDIKVSPSIIMFVDGTPEINAIGDEQIKQLINVLKYKK